VARAVLDPGRVVAALTPQAAPTLCDGLAGTALLHACLSHTAPQFANAAARHWDAAARLRRNAHPDGIYTGPGALAASLIIGSNYLPDPGPYRDTARRATAWLSARAEGLARHQQRRVDDHQPGAPWAVYDAIRGLSGIGRVLLAAHAAGHQDAAEPGLTAALTTLTTLIHTHHGARPGWWLPANHHPPAVTVHPTGAATTGMAHGIAGPVALLSIAHTAGRTVPGQHEAIRTAANWLLTWQEHSASWPPSVSGNDLDSPPALDQRRRLRGRRDAWCYGAPGIGRALTLAGTALAEPHLRRAGRTAVAALAERAPDQWDTDGPGLCHGSAGVLQAAIRAGSDSVANLAADRTLSFHDPRLPFAFPHLEAGVPLNTPGFLNGATGVALALADHSGLMRQEAPAQWDSLLLLS
jgi:hypothetical protein